MAEAGGLAVYLERLDRLVGWYVQCGGGLTAGGVQLLNRSVRATLTDISDLYGPDGLAAATQLLRRWQERAGIEG